MSLLAVELDLDTQVSEGGHRIEDFGILQTFALAGRARLRLVSAHGSSDQPAHRPARTQGPLRAYDTSALRRRVG